MSAKAATQKTASGLKMGRNPFQTKSPAQTETNTREPEFRKLADEVDEFESWLSNNFVTRTVIAGIKSYLVFRYLLKRKS
ncbi:MAG: hypothetical protein EBZ78_13140 [Verrucomicrobia bacterium]|nr:hypothetical protein [Verrucomicrobiota bacterium]